MILYFTGTGNSKYIADGIASYVDDEVVSLNDVIKFEQGNQFVSDKTYVFVAPIYAWRYPRIIENFISSAYLSGSKDVYCVATMGGDSGKAGDYLKNIVNSKGMNFKGFRGIIMPNNYIDPDTEEVVKKRLEDCLNDIKEISESILKGENIYKTDKCSLPGFRSKTINNMFYKYYVTDNSYTVSETCKGCGICEKLCPVNNIVIKDGKATFNNKCVACYSCIHHCPEKAINIKGKTEDKGRYVCPEFRK